MALHAEMMNNRATVFTPNGGLVQPIVAQGAQGIPGAQGDDGPQGPPGPGTGAGAWAPTTGYTASQVVQAPDGSLIRRNSTGTSRASFDSTEEALWTAVSAVSGTIEQRAQSVSLGAAIETDGTAPADAVDGRIEGSDYLPATFALKTDLAALALTGGFTPRGTWTAQAYNALDVVYRNGVSYVASAATTSADVPGVSSLWLQYATGLDIGSAADNFTTFDATGRVKPTRVITDSVARVDSASSAGSADTGQAWAPASTSVWGVSSNKLYLVTNGAAQRAILINAGLAGLTWSGDITLASGGEAGLVIAALDDANMLAVTLSAATGNGLIYSVNAGATSTRLTEAWGIAAGTYNLAISVTGDTTAATLSVWLNRVLIKEFTLSSADRTKFAVAGATRCGLRSASSTQANRFANLKADNPITATDKKLIEWDSAGAYEVVSATYDTDGFPSTGATLRWPDGTIGTFTLISKYTGPGVVAINSYSVSYPPRARLLTQAAPTRDSATGAVLTVPKATVGAA